MRLYQIRISEATDVRNNDTNVPGCLDVPEFVRTRRNFDMVCAMLGLMFSSLHFGLIVHIRYVQKRKGFFLLFMQVRRNRFVRTMNCGTWLSGHHEHCYAYTPHRRVLHRRVHNPRELCGYILPSFHLAVLR